MAKGDDLLALDRPFSIRSVVACASRLTTDQQGKEKKRPRTSSEECDPCQLLAGWIVDCNPSSALRWIGARLSADAARWALPSLASVQSPVDSCAHRPATGRQAVDVAPLAIDETLCLLLLPARIIPSRRRPASTTGTRYRAKRWSRLKETTTKLVASESHEICNLHKLCTANVSGNRRRQRMELRLGSHVCDLLDWPQRLDKCRPCLRPRSSQIQRASLAGCLHVCFSGTRSEMSDLCRRSCRWLSERTLHLLYLESGRWTSDWI